MGARYGVLTKQYDEAVHRINLAKQVGGMWVHGWIRNSTAVRLCDSAHNGQSRQAGTWDHILAKQQPDGRMLVVP